MAEFPKEYNGSEMVVLSLMMTMCSGISKFLKVPPQDGVMDVSMER
jgi:hypothetical protein